MFNIKVLIFASTMNVNDILYPIIYYADSSLIWILFLYMLIF